MGKILICFVGNAIDPRLTPPPQCGHCKALKPDWDKLTEEYSGSSDKLIAEVDCTADNAKDLCSEWGVEGFPTLKWGNPYALQDYEGGREYDVLKVFVEDSLKPTCGPKNLDLCDEEHKKEIEMFMKMTPEELKKIIDEKDEELKKINSEFESAVDSISQRYEEAEKAKKDKVAEIKSKGLGLMKAILTVAESS